MGNCLLLQPDNRLKSRPMIPVGQDGAIAVPLTERRKVIRRQRPTRVMYMGPFFTKQERTYNTLGDINN